MKISKWLEKNCSNLKDKKVVITGATGGLGREICMMIAELQGDIILACRNEELATKLKADILTTYPNTNIHFVQLDFSNRVSVDNGIKALKKFNGIDILINNAGVYNVPLKTLDSGFNNIFQINFAYTYYLTKKLIPELEKRDNSVCITLGSVAHNYSTLDEQDIDFSKRQKPSKIYGNSKRFLMFSLYHLFQGKNTKLAIVHPGVTLTNMTNHYPRCINWLVKIGIKILFPTPKKASLSVLYGINRHTPPHTWIGPRTFNIWGYPRLSKLKTCSEDESKKIFEIAENIYHSITSTKK